MIQFENAVERYNKIILTELKDAGVNCWLAGGAIRDYFMGVKINTDYDLFFPSKEEYDKCAVFFKAKDAAIKWESDNGMKVSYNGRTFDLVKHFYPGPQECIEAFDFTASMLAVDSEKVYHGETTFIDLAKRQLMINKLPFPASTLSRAFRYYKKGFSMCLGEMAKLIKAIQEMPKEVEDETGEEGEKSSSELASLFIGID
jgi:hypothetical protein